MPHSKESSQKNCPGCGVLLDIVTEWSGGYRANERERAECPKCGAVAPIDKCLGITASNADQSDK
jgi:ribosomal protein S27AE